jgi:hypothetical protein
MKIELTEKQAKVIETALEVYQRLRIAQFDIALEQAFLDKKPFVKIDDKLLIQLRELYFDLEDKDRHLREVNCSNGIGQDEDCNIAYDVYQVLRYDRQKEYKDEFYVKTPIPFSSEGLPKID